MSLCHSGCLLVSTYPGHTSLQALFNLGDKACHAVHVHKIAIATGLMPLITDHWLAIIGMLPLQRPGALMSAKISMEGRLTYGRGRV